MQERCQRACADWSGYRVKAASEGYRLQSV